MNSQSEEDYLKALYHLQAESNTVTTNSVADYLKMKPSSVTDMLKKLAEKISADSTFFVNGGLQGGEGKGEVLTTIKHPLKDQYILLVMPNIKIQTSEAFMFIKKYLVKGQTHVKLSQMLEELQLNKLSSELFYNDFEMYVFKTHPEIGKIKLEILDLGAKYASLSGSGSTVFGIFSDKHKAQKAQSFFSPHYSTIIANPKI